MTRNLLCICLLVFAAGRIVKASPESDIQAVLTTQVESWNRADLATFVMTYAGDCVFVGKKVTQGRAELLARYQRDYPTAAAMGHLTFSGLAVHLLNAETAFVTAEWRLERSSAGGGSAGGLFSLVLHRQADGWKIALDHTS